MSSRETHLSVDEINQGLRSRADRFARDEGGAMIVFGLMVFLMMLVASGMAIDFMRHENTRTRLQGTLDRAVLAAADLDQENDPEAVVRDYFAKSGLGKADLDVRVDEGGNFRTVSARAGSDVDSMFLNLVGIDTIRAPAGGVAEERVNQVEISLILDVSGSMNDSGKIGDLRTSAQEFVNTLLTDETRDRISMSMVPYTGHTNAGADILDHYNLDRVHSFSNCIEFSDADFNTTSLSRTASLEQVPHFEYNFSLSGSPLTNAYCPTRTEETILAFQNENEALNKRIRAFEPRNGTGIHYAMKWGVAILDPEFRPVVDSLSTSGIVPAAFKGRPSNFKDPDTQKVIVLMTDGENFDQWRPRPDLYDSPEDIDFAANNGFRPNFELELVQSARGSGVSGRNSSDENLLNMCQLARAEEVLVYTIGFDLTPGSVAQQVMTNCASSDSHAYNAGLAHSTSGLTLSQAFNSIARNITQLRLTQ